MIRKALVFERVSILQIDLRDRKSFSYGLDLVRKRRNLRYEMSLTGTCLVEGN